MEHRDEVMSERLLSRLPQPADLSNYQQEVTCLLAENEKSLRKNKWTVVRVWIFVAVVSGPFLWMAGRHFGASEGNWFLGLACFWVLFGAVEVLKYVIHQWRLGLLKEIKQLQLQVLELHALLKKSEAPVEPRY